MFYIFIGVFGVLYFFGVLLLVNKVAVLSHSVLGNEELLLCLNGVVLEERVNLCLVGGSGRNGSKRRHGLGRKAKGEGRVARGRLGRGCAVVEDLPEVAKVVVGDLEEVAVLEVSVKGGVSVPRGELDEPLANMDTVFVGDLTHVDVVNVSNLHVAHVPKDLLLVNTLLLPVGSEGVGNAEGLDNRAGLGGSGHDSVKRVCVLLYTGFGCLYA